MRVVIGWAFVKRLLRLNVRKPSGGSPSRAEYSLDLAMAAGPRAGAGRNGWTGRAIAFLYDLAVLRRRQRHRPLSANTFWVGRRADGNAGPTQRLALHPANGRKRREAVAAGHSSEGLLIHPAADARLVGRNWSSCPFPVI